MSSPGGGQFQQIRHDRRHHHHLTSSRRILASEVRAAWPIESSRRAPNAETPLKYYIIWTTTAEILLNASVIRRSSSLIQRRGPP